MRGNLKISNGYVVYQRGADSNVHFWRDVHRIAKTEADQIERLYSSDILSKYAAAGRRLIALGKQEQKKEIELIQRTFPESKVSGSEDVREFVKMFNHVLMGVKQFEHATKRLSAATSKQSKTKDNRAPTQASWFTSYLSTALTRGTEEFLKGRGEKMTEMDIKEWEEQVDSIINKAIKEGFEGMLNKMEGKEGKELYGDSEEWKEIYEASRLMDEFDEYFVEMMRDRINFDNIKRVIQDAPLNLKNQTKKGITTFMNSAEGGALGTESVGRSVGGSVQEFIMMILEQMGEGAKAAASSGGKVFTQQLMKADTVAVFNFGREVDIEKTSQALADIMNQAMEENRDILDAPQVMKDFYEKHLKNLRDTFIVYGSTKSYSMSENFGSFNAINRQQIERAGHLIERAGQDASLVEAYIRAAYSSAEGAILENRREDIKEGLRTELMSVVAEALFDDWVSIGQQEKGSARSIHTLQLEGIELPLSVFLIAAGKAMEAVTEDMIKSNRGINEYISVSISLPKTILPQYAERVPVGEGGIKDVFDAWDHQRKVAKTESTLTLKFLKNFKTVIKDWIDIA